MPVDTLSVIKETNESSPIYNDLVIRLSTVADDITPWSAHPKVRDGELRRFWPTEPLLASAIYSTAARYAAFGWTLTGPPRTVGVVQRLLHGVEFGRGWIPFISKVIIDLFTQDNGAFIEVVRADNTETSPVLSLNHLDANRCVRTGRRKVPVIYFDNQGNGHELKWFQVIDLVEMPSPIEEARGIQYCAVTRLLRAAQIMRDISIYKREKISGRFTRAIHLVSGVQRQTIINEMTRAREGADNQGLIRYMEPVIIGSLDPTANVSVATIELASLPDGFDAESELRWYVNQLALAFGTDYQDFAPLPGGNLGTAQQSQTLHLKSRGKGPKLFMSLLEHIFNFHGILPNTVTFTFGDQDIAEDMEHVELRKMRAQERDVRIKNGEITPQVARQIAVDDGDLDVKYLEMLNESDVTPVETTTVPSNEPRNPQDNKVTTPSNERANSTNEDTMKVPSNASKNNI